MRKRRLSPTRLPRKPQHLNLRKHPLKSPLPKRSLQPVSLQLRKLSLRPLPKRSLQQVSQQLRKPLKQLKLHPNKPQQRPMPRPLLQLQQQPTQKLKTTPQRKSTVLNTRCSTA